MRSAASGFLDGMALPLRGLRLLAAHRSLWGWALLPLLLSGLFYAGAFALFVAALTRWDWGAYSLAWFGEWGRDAFNLAKWILLLPLAGLVAYLSFTAVGMVLASPVNDMLSERIERILTGREAPALPWRRAVAATFWSALDSLRIVLAQVLATLLALPLLLVPGVGAAALFLLCAWYAGLGFLDVAMARNLLRPAHKRAGLRGARARVLGLGVAMQLLFLVPFLGLLLLPAGVAAGTLLYAGQPWRARFAEANLPLPEGFAARDETQAQAQT